MPDLHPATTAVLRHFRYDHLPAHLQEVSKPFADLAHHLAATLSGPEVTRALGDLFNAKNWAVCARLAQDEAPASTTTEN